MTREEAIERIKGIKSLVEKYDDVVALRMAIEALEQEPRKDEVILTKKEYGELVSSEFENGYAKGYREAMEEQESCEDAVSRKEIQQKINRLWNSNGDKNYCMETLKDFVTDLPPVTPTQRWIPCSERLPKESGFYLVSTTDCITIMEFIGGEWISQNIGSCNWYVKAWMPLPEPYEGDKNEKNN